MHKLIFTGILAFAFGCNAPKEQAVEEHSSDRMVEGNTIISPNTPKIKIEVADEFDYVGQFDFEIIANSEEYPKDLQGMPVAAGERLVFVKAGQDRRVEKLFIVQYEGFLQSNDFVYNYDFSNADYIGDNKYRHNTWYYDNKVAIQENPLGESAKTDAFLKNEGFQTADHFMMSRFVGLASEDRKNEIIIYYIEMLKASTGYSLDEWENTVPEAEATGIDSSLIARSRMSFRILK